MKERKLKKRVFVTHDIFPSICDWSLCKSLGKAFKKVRAQSWLNTTVCGPHKNVSSTQPCLGVSSSMSRAESIARLQWRFAGLYTNIHIFWQKKNDFYNNCSFGMACPRYGEPLMVIGRFPISFLQFRCRKRHSLLSKTLKENFSTITILFFIKTKQESFGRVYFSSSSLCQSSSFFSIPPSFNTRSQLLLPSSSWWCRSVCVKQSSVYLFTTSVPREVRSPTNVCGIWLHRRVLKHSRERRSLQPAVSPCAARENKYVLSRTASGCIKHLPTYLLTSTGGLWRFPYSERSTCLCSHEKCDYIVHIRAFHTTPSAVRSSGSLWVWRPVQTILSHNHKAL